MNQLAIASARLEQATDVPAILAAAGDAFEDMLPVLHEQQDPAGGAFTTFVMSAALAANGRDAVLRAASMPVHTSGRRSAGEVGRWAALEAATTLAGLGRLLDGKLTEAADSAVNRADRQACLDGAEQARRLAGLLAAALGP